jgi:predicted RNA-binding protein with PUA-like domain
MAHWLLKSDPETYGFADLERDRRTTWDGVSNPQALIYLRQMKKGDAVLVYHSGADKAVIGRATVVRGPYPDPKLSDPKRVVVDLAAGPRLAEAVSLATLRADPAFHDLGLVRQSRLSVMPVTPAQWKRLLALGRG